MPSKDRPYYVLGLLVLIYMSNYVDRVVVGVLGEPIKADLKITDTQLGLLTGIVFVIFYGVLGVPVGRLADRLNRKWLLSACLALWSIFTTLSGFAGTFTQLMAARLFVGIGEAGCTPSAHSLLSDVFPRNRRSMAFSVYAIGPPAGIIVGTLGGGWIAQEMGWRSGMIAVGLPGLVLAAIMMLTVREPKRGQYDGPVEDSVPSFLTALRTFWNDKLFICVMFGMACAAVGLYSISTFSVPFLIRAFHLKLFAAASIFGLSYGIAGIIGASLGGIITDWAGTRDARWYAGVPALGYLFGGGLLTGALFQTSVHNFVLMFVFGSVLANIALAPSLAVVLNRVGVRMRASASAVMLLMSTLVGLGLGPTSTGALSDVFAKHAFVAAPDYIAACPGGHAMPAHPGFEQACQAASFYGLQHALSLTVGFYLVAALIYVIATQFVAMPETRVAGAGLPRD
jgi:predicted MFS family arabinose efflux permease